MMGIKGDDLSIYLESDTNGFIYNSAQSFLKRHSSPEALFAQLKNLLFHGELSSCHDLIHLILREGHALADYPQVYLLRAQIAFEQSETMGEVMSWVQQAKLCNKKSTDYQEWDILIDGITSLKDGDYKRGETKLISLLEVDSVSVIAKYSLAHHYFWRNKNDQFALTLLEELTHERPAFLMAQSCLGFLYNKIGLKEKAQNTFSLCLKHETNPERIKFYRQLLAS